jgi:hypothetical protein
MKTPKEGKEGKEISTENAQRLRPAGGSRSVHGKRETITYNRMAVFR